jgi:hypothetical protein
MSHSFSHALHRLKTLPPSAAARFLLVFNTITAIFGLVFLGASFYAKNQARREVKWADTVTNQISMMGVAAGVLTIFLSMFGCFTTLFRSRQILMCYLAVFCMVWIVQVIATAGVGGFSGMLKMKDESLPSSSLTFPLDIQIQNAAFSAYQRCCSGCPNDTITNAPVCNNQYDDSWVPYVLPNCQSTIIQCQFVQACSNNTLNKCFKFLPKEPVIVPAYYVDSTTCDMLSSAQVTNSQGQKVRIVGHVDTGSCGGGDPSVFLKNLDQFLSRNLAGMSIIFGLIVFFEAVMVLPAVFYLYHSKDSHWAIEAGEEEEHIGMGSTSTSQMGGHHDLIQHGQQEGIAMDHYYSGFQNEQQAQLFRNGDGGSTGEKSISNNNSGEITKDIVGV